MCGKEYGKSVGWKMVSLGLSRVALSGRVRLACGAE